MPSSESKQTASADTSAAGTSAQVELHAAPTAGEIPVESRALDLVGILSSVQETAYLWDLTTDRIDWESNAAEVLGVRNASIIATATEFNFLIAPEHVERRQQAVSGVPSEAAGKGVHYRVQYRFTPHGRRSDHSLWLEDHGRCWFDAEGKPLKARGIIRVINERYLEEQRLLYRSDHDELTGQLNRIRLTDALGAVATRAVRSRQPCCFLMVAVNNLAVINETFGFDVGDEVIAATARIIRRKLRGGDTIGRYSSNKFGVILNECGPGAMRVAADRLIKAVREATIEASGCQISASISVGGVLLPDHAETAHQALSHSLQALDQAKARRQEAFMAYEPSAAKESIRRRNITIADEVISALDSNRMLIALQPIVHTASRQPDIYECLLRMERPDGLIVSAGEFIAVAEQLGLSRLIDRRTLELSIDVLRKHPDIKLSVNVSSLTASDHEWLVTLHRLTGGRRQLLERLTVEITETAAIHDLDLSINFVDTLKELGCKVAIDDFGAGYTSFKNLKILDVDMVKIDGSFVKNLIEEPTNRVFIKTLVEIAETFGLETVAEWVGDEETARIVADCGITHMQGYHFGLPLMASELPAPPEATATSDAAE
ncbi:MAG: EAL domain-containing protein [Hyphomicrobiaceae bacterium]|nr:EAL domain-containing protein [Hyphomicrobiaceae bacterium]